MTISATDLTSNLVDLTTVPLRDLREARKHQMSAEIENVMAGDFLDVLGEIQMQNQ